MAKVRKKEASDRKKRDESTPMAKLIVAQQNENGQYRYIQKIVRESDVKDEIKAIRD